MRILPLLFLAALIVTAAAELRLAGLRVESLAGHAPLHFVLMRTVEGIGRFQLGAATQSELEGASRSMEEVMCEKE